MERDLTIFTAHTNQHIVDEVKKSRPAWITENGYCPKCLDYFKRVMGHADAPPEDLEPINIGPLEVRKRFMMALTGAVAGLVMIVWLKQSEAPKVWRLFVFLPFFGGALGFLQAKTKLCVVYAQKNLRNMDRGEEPVTNPVKMASIRQKSLGLWIISALIAGTLSAVCFAL